MSQSSDTAPPPGQEAAHAALPECVLITGFPALSAQRVAARILAQDTEARLYALVRDDELERTADFLAALPAQHAGRVELFSGAVERMDLGLAGAEYRRLCDEITTVHHLAGIADTTSDERVARAVNVHGTSHVLELAGDARDLRRLCHYSSVSVSGTASGLFREDDLERGQSFHNPYEATRHRAEILVRRAMRRLPVSVFRLGIVVGDSQTGEIDRFDGPYFLMVAMITNPSQVALPTPNLGETALNLVPVDFVARAAYALSVDPRAAGRTFHLIDPEPVSARRVYDLVAEHSHKRPPRQVMPNRVARILLRVPGVERVTRGQRFFLEELAHRARYGCENTRELLADTGIGCPNFESYVDNLVRYIEACHPAAAHAESDEPPDPLA